jgi:hypothetical protein
MRNSNDVSGHMAYGPNKTTKDPFGRRSASVLPLVGVTLLLVDMAAVVVNLMMLE